MKTALDLCSGTKSATISFVQAGWKVLTVDVNEKFNPDICMDVRLMTTDNALYPIDFIWASPPCTEFAREFMPWCKTGRDPDLSIVKACFSLIKNINPTYWCIENVRGAIPWFRMIGLGAPRAIVGPFHLWGNFPELPIIDTSTWRKKESMSSAADTQRGAIPIELSQAMLWAISNQDMLFPTTI